MFIFLTLDHRSSINVFTCKIKTVVFSCGGLYIMQPWWACYREFSEYIVYCSPHIWGKMPLRHIQMSDLSDLSSPNRPCLSLSLLVQFLSAWVLVCSELQSGPRSFIQNQMRVWQHLHLRHFSARQLRLGKSSDSSRCLCFFFVHHSP